MGTIVPGSGVEVLPPGKRYVYYMDSWNPNVVNLAMVKLVLKLVVFKCIQGLEFKFT